MSVPMPSGIVSMSKEELWEWFQRSTRAHKQISDTRRMYFSVTTGLHSCHAEQFIPSYLETIELQRQKIVGLSKQMQQMNKGYQKKIARLEAIIDSMKSEAV